MVWPQKLMVGSVPQCSYGTAQRQLDTHTRSMIRAPTVKISSACYMHVGAR